MELGPIPPQESRGAIGYRLDADCVELPLGDGDGQRVRQHLVGNVSLVQDEHVRGGTKPSHIAFLGQPCRVVGTDPPPELPQSYVVVVPAPTPLLVGADETSMTRALVTGGPDAGGRGS